MPAWLGDGKPGTGQGRVGSPLPAAPTYSPACSGWTLRISLGFGLELGAGAAPSSSSTQACLGWLGGLPAILREGGRKGVRGTPRPPGAALPGVVGQRWLRSGGSSLPPCPNTVLPHTVGPGPGDTGCHKVPQCHPPQAPRSTRPQDTSLHRGDGSDSLFLLLPLWGWGSSVLGASPLSQGPLCPLSPCSQDLVPPPPVARLSRGAAPSPSGTPRLFSLGTRLWRVHPP